MDIHEEVANKAIGFYKDLRTTQAPLRAEREQLEVESFELFEETIALLDRNRNSWRSDGGQYLFNDRKVAASFEALRNRMESCISKQMELGKKLMR